MFSSLDIKDKNVVIRGTDGELAVYFSPKEASPSKDAVHAAISHSVLDGDCIAGYDGRLPYGEVRLFFNPVFQTDKNRERTITAVLNAIMNPDPSAVLPDINPAHKDWDDDDDDWADDGDWDYDTDDDDLDGGDWNFLDNGPGDDEGDLIFH